MAIKIPSANIYQKENNKIVTNSIKKVFSTTKSSYNEEKLRTNVYSLETNLNEQSVYSEQNSKRAYYDYRASSYGGTVGGSKYYFAISSTEVLTKSVKIPRFGLKKYFKNGKIQKIYTGVKDDKSTNIYVNITYDVEEEDAEQKITSKSNYWSTTTEQKELTENNADFGAVSYNKVSQGTTINEVPTTLFDRTSAFLCLENIATVDSASADSSIRMYVKDDIADEEIITWNRDTLEYEFKDFYVAVYFQTLTMSAVYESIGVTAVVPPKELTLKGKRTTYKPKKMEINIYGDTYEIKFRDEKISVGTGEPSITMDGNELFQSSSFVKEDTGDKNAVNYFFEKIVDNYEEGKETATIRCSISNYYDENGKKAININSNKLSFDIGDEVIPFVYNENGVDIPMSKYSDGSPKKFIVCKLKYIYDGAVWQELTLREARQSE